MKIIFTFLVLLIVASQSGCGRSGGNGGAPQARADQKPGVTPPAVEDAVNKDF
jgi:predicted small lipoprotein YifL